ncbi:unnamed protein product, partial [Protopolystoma xenopodis]
MNVLRLNAISHNTSIHRQATTTNEVSTVAAKAVGEAQPLGRLCETRHLERRHMERDRPTRTGAGSAGHHFCDATSARQTPSVGATDTEAGIESRHAMTGNWPSVHLSRKPQPMQQQQQHQQQQQLVPAGCYLGTERSETGRSAGS